MGYSIPLVDYKSRILLADGTYKGILETAEGFVVQDLNKGTNFGIYGSLEKALIMAAAYQLNLLSETPQPAPKSTAKPRSMPTLIEAPSDNPDNSTLMSFEAYCALFANPKNKSGYRFITDQSESTGWVILKEGRSEYGRYGSVQEALQEAFAVKLNLN
jgi:hypothetical protein